jgi:hypothetical protein
MDELITTWKIDHSETAKASKQSISDSGRLVTFIASLIAIRSGKCALLSLLYVDFSLRIFSIDFSL